MKVVVDELRIARINMEAPDEDFIVMTDLIDIEQVVFKVSQIDQIIEILKHMKENN